MFLMRVLTADSDIRIVMLISVMLLSAASISNTLRSLGVKLHSLRKRSHSDQIKSVIFMRYAQLRLTNADLRQHKRQHRTDNAPDELVHQTVPPLCGFGLQHIHLAL